jgi:uncharacterized protein with HEPN domain
MDRLSADRPLAEYQSDVLLRSAVERQLEIIGEALNQALKHFPELADRISESRQIIAFRNRLIHGYATIAADVVWAVVTGDLPRLRAKVEQLLAEG